MGPTISVSKALGIKWPIIDVRSPGEFASGHIPEATNLPLFSDEERAHIGTVYVQESQEKATALGYEYVKPKLEWFISRANEIAPQGRAIVHCWRGGMRSRSFAQHLSENGLREIAVIERGYKAYRNFVLEKFAEPHDLRVLGGYTGSGKTYILEELRSLGQQIIDLEGLAHHKGSAFGGLGQSRQPTVEQFENNLFEAIRQLDSSKPIWVEDESHNIGRVKIPMAFFQQMQQAKVFFIHIPKAVRAAHLVNEYAGGDSHELAESIERIGKRLGSLNKKKALAFLTRKNYYEVAMLALQYYDKFYLRGIEKRDHRRVLHIPLSANHHKNNARHLLNREQQL
jgi:tRNA 2-selenouridine synthase